MTPIAILQGAPSAAIQQLMRDFVTRHADRMRIVGLIEEDADACETRRCRSVPDGRMFDLFDALGSGSTACALNAAGVVEAGEHVRGQITRGCDVVVLSKFGKLEAENRSGLVAAFAAALEAGVPVVTSVAPKYDVAWSAFAAPLYAAVPADAAALDAWLHAQVGAEPARVG